MSFWPYAALIVFILVGLPVTTSFLLRLARILKGNGSAGRSARDESRLLQEMHRSLNGLESRIEALETILIETKEQKESRDE